MKNEEARFILRAYRSDGRYRTDDPLFAKALEEATRDPALAAWLEREQMVDSVVANKLEGVQPPAGLRDAILVGARASRLRRTWWRSPPWIAAAAALVVAAALPVVSRFTSAPPANAADLGEFSLVQLATGLHRHATAPGVAALEAALAATPLPFHTGLSLDIEHLRSTGCQSFKLAGREVFEICFERDGTWYHLYVMRRDPRAGDVPSGPPMFLQQGGHCAAVWATATAVYSLVTDEDPKALKALL